MTQQSDRPAALEAAQLAALEQQLNVEWAWDDDDAAIAQRWFHALLSAAKEGERMRVALEKAARQFEFYRDEHLTKWRDESLPASVQSAALIKSETNYLMAKMCRAALEPQP